MSSPYGAKPTNPLRTKISYTRQRSLLTSAPWSTSPCAPLSICALYCETHKSNTTIGVIQVRFTYSEVVERPTRWPALAGSTSPARLQRTTSFYRLKPTTEMTEDEIHRTSTQYRLWSFTVEALARLRATTNALAADGVRDAIQSKRAEAESNGDSERSRATTPLSEVDCLTVEEEQRLVGFYCLKAMEFAGFLEFPTNVMVSTSGVCLCDQCLADAWS